MDMKYPERTSTSQLCPNCKSCGCGGIISWKSIQARYISFDFGWYGLEVRTCNFPARKFFSICILFHFIGSVERLFIYLPVQTVSHL
jgi:hypothetical protein